MAGQTAESDALCQSKRLLLCAGPYERPVPAGQAVRESELGGGSRREGTATTGSGHGADCQGHGNLPWQPGWDRIGTTRPNSPHTGLFYVPTWVNYSTLFSKEHVDYVEGRQFGGGVPRFTTPRGYRTATNDYHTDSEGYGAIRALDPKTGERKWEYKMTNLTDAGILTTSVGSVVQRRAGGVFLRAGQPFRRAAVEGDRRWGSRGRANHVLGRWATVRDDRCRQRAVLVGVA